MHELPEHARRSDPLSELPECNHRGPDEGGRFRCSHPAEHFEDGWARPKNCRVCLSVGGGQVAASDEPERLQPEDLPCPHRSPEIVGQVANEHCGCSNRFDPIFACSAPGVVECALVSFSDKLDRWPRAVCVSCQLRPK